MRPRCGYARFGHSTATDRCVAGLPPPPASPALLGIRLELGLQGRKLGEGRVWIDLGLALAMRRVVAAFPVLASIFRETRSLAAHVLRAIIPRFGTTLGAMLSLAPVAAVVAFVPESSLPAAHATMPCSVFFGLHAWLNCRLGSAVRRD